MAENDFTPIKRHTFTVSFGSIIIAPLVNEPELEFERSVEESFVYENGDEPVAAFIQRNNAVITFDTKDVYTALELLEGFSTGDDIMASERLQPLIFTPQAEGEKTLVFPRAFLKPDASYVPCMGEDHFARLVFKALPDPKSKKLFTFS